MLISQVWVDLAEHDLAASMPDAHHVILTGPSGERMYLLRILTRPPGPRTGRQGGLRRQRRAAARATHRTQSQSRRAACSSARRHVTVAGSRQHRAAHPRPPHHPHRGPAHPARDHRHPGRPRPAALGHDRDRHLSLGGQRLHAGRLGRARWGVPSTHFPGPARPATLGPAGPIADGLPPTPRA